MWQYKGLIYFMFFEDFIQIMNLLICVVYVISIYEKSVLSINVSYIRELGTFCWSSFSWNKIFNMQMWSSEGHKLQLRVKVNSLRLGMIEIRQTKLGRFGGSCSPDDTPVGHERTTWDLAKSSQGCLVFCVVHLGLCLGAYFSRSIFSFPFWLFDLPTHSDH